jgi:iron-sulfur cluster repair protein YtfE (RIC family)
VSKGLIAREHAIVRAHLDHMRSIADNMPFEISLTLRDRLDAVLSFFHNDLVSHLKVEDQVLYPVFDRMADAGWSSPAMRFDHEMITSMLGQLDEAIADTQRARWRDEVQRLLFVLEAVVGLHLAKEERLATPLLRELDSRASAPLRRLLAGHMVQHHHAPWGSPLTSSHHELGTADHAEIAPERSRQLRSQRHFGCFSATEEHLRP